MVIGMIRCSSRGEVRDYRCDQVFIQWWRYVIIGMIRCSFSGGGMCCATKLSIDSIVYCLETSKNHIYKWFSQMVFEAQLRTLMS